MVSYIDRLAQQIHLREDKSLPQMIVLLLVVCMRSSISMMNLQLPAKQYSISENKGPLDLSENLLKTSATCTTYWLRSQAEQVIKIHQPLTMFNISYKIYVHF